MSHLIGLFLLYIKQHDIWNHPTLDDCKALMRPYESTGFEISDIVCFLMPVGCMKKKQKKPNQTGPEMTPQMMSA